MFFRNEAAKYTALAQYYIVPDSAKCVQCGICTYNCPIGIDVRLQVWHQKTMKNTHCLACGECVARCPRGVLRFAQSEIFTRHDI